MSCTWCPSGDERGYTFCPSGDKMGCKLCPSAHNMGGLVFQRSEKVRIGLEKEVSKNIIWAPDAKCLAQPGPRSNFIFGKWPWFGPDHGNFRSQTVLDRPFSQTVGKNRALEGHWKYLSYRIRPTRGTNTVRSDPWFLAGYVSVYKCTRLVRKWSLCAVVPEFRQWCHP